MAIDVLYVCICYSGILHVVYNYTIISLVTLSIDVDVQHLITHNIYDELSAFDQV